MKLALLIKDKDIINEVKNDPSNNFGIIFVTISDDAYNRLNCPDYEKSFNDDGSINLTISMKELKHVPHTLKLNIWSVNKGILKPITVELKR